MVRVVGPPAVAAGQPVVTRRNVIAFGGAMLMLWLASDWPIHDVGEQYLYSVHMLQHMMLAYFLPPLVLLATPEWLLRVLVGDGRLYAVVRWLCKPVVAGVLFNLAVMVTHIPGVVNASVTSDRPFVHYSLHLMVVTTGLLDVDAGLRAVPRAAHGHGGHDDLPLPHVGRPDRARRLAGFRRGLGVRRLRPAGPRVGPLGHRRPADRRSGDEDGRVDLPLVDHRHALVHPLRRPPRRRVRLPASADVRRRRARVRTGRRRSTNPSSGSVARS